MPIAAAELFGECNLTVGEVVRWGGRVTTTAPGVYAVSLSANGSANAGLCSDGPVSKALVQEWIARVPGFLFDGMGSPNPEEVTTFLQKNWLPDESIVYIGKATSLRARLGQLFRHRLGDCRPHAGGHWLKALSLLSDCHVFIVPCETVAIAEAKEQELLGAFVRQVSSATTKALYCRGLPIPFANREYPPGVRKQARISRDVLR